MLVLDDNIQNNLRKLLPTNPPKERAKRSANKPAKKLTHNSTSENDATAGTPAHDPIEREAAAADSNTTTSGVAPLDESATDPRTQPLWNVRKEDVALPVELADRFARWKAHPSAFLWSDSAYFHSSLKEHYDYALSVSNSTISNQILWRFISTAYYDVISAHSESERYSITREAVAFAVSVICKSSLYDREKVERHIISWATEGAKYRALANELESLAKELGILADKSDVLGCYFFFPKISEWM